MLPSVHAWRFELVTIGQIMAHVIFHALTVSSVTFTANSVKVFLVGYPAYDTIMVSDRDPPTSVEESTTPKNATHDDEEEILGTGSWNTQTSHDGHDRKRKNCTSCSEVVFNFQVRADCWIRGVEPTAKEAIIQQHSDAAQILGSNDQTAILTSAMDCGCPLLVAGLCSENLRSRLRGLAQGGRLKITVDRLEIPPRTLGIEIARPDLQFGVLSHALAFGDEPHLVVFLEEQSAI
jgi:hypothetical protein